MNGQKLKVGIVGAGSRGILTFGKIISTRNYAQNEIGERYPSKSCLPDLFSPSIYLFVSFEI